MTRSNQIVVSAVGPEILEAIAWAQEAWGLSRSAAAKAILGAGVSALGLGQPRPTRGPHVVDVNHGPHVAHTVPTANQWPTRGPHVVGHVRNQNVAAAKTNGPHVAHTWPTGSPPPHTPPPIEGGREPPTSSSGGAHPGGFAAGGIENQEGERGSTGPTFREKFDVLAELLLAGRLDLDDRAEKLVRDGIKRAAQGKRPIRPRQASEFGALWRRLSRDGLPGSDPAPKANTAREAKSEGHSTPDPLTPEEEARLAAENAERIARLIGGDQPEPVDPSVDPDDFEAKRAATLRALGAKPDQANSGCPEGIFSTPGGQPPKGSAPRGQPSQTEEG